MTVNNFTSNKAVISLSGGLDSTMLLLDLLSKGLEVRAYSFYYGQKHKIELEKVQNNIKFLREKGYPVSHQIINVEDVFADNTSALVSSTGEDIPHGHYDEENMKSTVVPLRNVIFSSIIYSKAINWAVQSNENVFITLGIHSGDHAIYCDCRPESHDACKKAFELSDWNSGKVDYIAPFVNINKGKVLRAGLDAMLSMHFSNGEMRQVLSNTHTCYDPNDAGEACGLCGSCTERLEAFAANGIKDPVPYQDQKAADKYWIEYKDKINE